MREENQPGNIKQENKVVQIARFVCVVVRCAAVLFSENGCHYTDGIPGKAIVDNLAMRNDSQIMALEQVAIALGLRTFLFIT